MPSRTALSARVIRRWVISAFALFPSVGCEQRPAVNAPAPQPTPPAPAASVSTSRPSVASQPLAAIAPRKPTGAFIDRSAPDVVRVVSYNIQWNSVFPDVDAKVAARFARIVRALDPDVLALQEIGLHPEDRDKPDGRRWTGEDVRKLLDTIAPLPDGRGWHAHQGYTNVIASKYPLSLTSDRTDPAAQRGLALAFVDLPDGAFAFDLYVVNTHHKCCGGVDNDPQRQQQSDAIVAWLRDAREPGGRVEVSSRTGLIVLGDFNIVGGPQPLTTIVDGNIIDETRYGPDTPPDWDGSAMTDARPRHNRERDEDWTWRNDTTQYPPGRLDYIIFSDSLLTLEGAFALNTMAMSDEDLTAAGLERFDAAKDDEGLEIDHLPLVADFAGNGR